MGAAIKDDRGRLLLIRRGHAPRAGDAADARWVAAGELELLPITEGLVEALTSWSVLGRRRY
jgi:hypothetical protein